MKLLKFDFICCTIYIYIVLLYIVYASYILNKTLVFENLCSIFFFLFHPRCSDVSQTIMWKHSRPVLICLAEYSPNAFSAPEVLFLI